MSAYLTTMGFTIAMIAVLNGPYKPHLTERRGDAGGDVGMQEPDSYIEIALPRDERLLILDLYPKDTLIVVHIAGDDISWLYLPYDDSVNSGGNNLIDTLREMSWVNRNPFEEFDNGSR